MDISALLSPSDDSSPMAMGTKAPTASPRPHSRPPFRETNSSSSVNSLLNDTSASPLSNPRYSPRKGSVTSWYTHTMEKSRDEQMVDVSRTSRVSSVDESRRSSLSPVDSTIDEPAEKVEPLSEADYERIANLLEFITDRPYQYESHVEYISLLHRGFLAHQADYTRCEPYPLFADLRKAREEMIDRFPMKESMWVEWISDEATVAKELEERLAVVELCARAVDEEGGSVKLWKAYAEFMQSQYLGTDLHDPKGKGKGVMSAEDRAAMKEIFKMESVIDVYKQGALKTINNIAESHEIWDRYRDLVMRDLEAEPTPAKLDYVRNLYKDHLQVPHANIADTFSAFSSFVTQYDNANYESIMVNTNKLFAAAQAKYHDRELYELRLQREKDSLENEWAAWSDYLQWETNQPKRKLDIEMACALYERCLLRFGERARVWEDYVYFVLEKANDPSTTIPLLKRATRHCPWSGTLWAQYIIALERSFKPFEEVSEVKHKATTTGMLDLSGLEEVLKVNIAWCEFLKRRAFESDAGEDDFDMAEMGISEAVTETGKDDPEYRLQRIHINFCTLAKRIEAARSIWRELAKEHGNSYEYWLRQYQWELAHGSKETAGSVLKVAVARTTLDWPEKILETWKCHVEDYGNVRQVEEMMIKYRKLMTAVVERRQKEATAAAEQAAQQAVHAEQYQAEKAPASETASEKRKRRRSIAEADDHITKKSKPAESVIEEETPAEHQPPSETSVAKRDRENRTLFVKGLPPSCPEVKVRQFFRGCGNINSIKVINEKDGDSATSTVEFESREDVLTAQTKDMKFVEGRQVRVQVGTGTTLYVTNFPPTADEAYIRDLFKDCGEIVDIRFPSLKFNTHRRFCYVQFLSVEQARKATELDGKQLGEKETLVAKISAPNQKKERSGAVYDGREVYIRNIHFHATERDVKTLFEKYGKIEKVRLPPGPKPGSHKGFGFVVFSSKEEAEASLELNGTPLKSRILEVSIAQTNPGKHKPVSNRSISPSPSPSTAKDTDNAHPNGANNKNRDTASPAPQTQVPSFDTIQKKTLGIMNLPDTVNDAKIRSLFEKFGPLRKVTLRPDHAGAIVEYENVNDAGKASLAMDGTEVAGKRIKIGSLPELMLQRPEKKETKGFVKGGKEAGGGGAAMFRPLSLRGVGAGGRGTGQKRKTGLGFTGGLARREKTGEEGKEVEAGKGGKSNEDFKKMFLES
ncbi:Splicing factor [Rhizina undulata]